MRLFKSACTAPMVVAVALAIAALVGCSQRDDSDPPDGRCGLVTYTDNLTGCQYLVRPGYVLVSEKLTPRMRADGSQVCTTGREHR